MADTVGTSALPEQMPLEGVVPGSGRGNRGRRRYYNNRRNIGNIQESRADQTSNIENSTTVSNMESGRRTLPNGAYHTGRNKEYRSSQNKTSNLHSQAESTSDSHDIGEINTRSAVTVTNNAQRGGKPQFTRGYRNQTHRGQQDRQPKPQEKPRISHKFNPNAIPFVPPQPAVRLMNVVDLPNSTPVEYPKNNTVTRVNNNRRNHQRTNDASVSKHKVKSVPHNKNKHPKRVENINAPLRERLKNRLEDNDYECMICCQIITAKQGIWSCKKCYNMFHISGNCIINWARKSRQDDSEDQWRCPTCQTKYTQIPYNYYCFCGKDRNPSVQIGETPHSCGQVCGGVRGPGCPHPCSEPCHPGPCAECPVMVTQQCNCGKIEKTTRCGAGLQVSCDQVCDRLLSCRNHRCTKICHAGDCAPCEMRTQQKCYCQLDEKEVPCHSGDIYKYSCGRPCTGKYSCGVHDCNNRCHPKGKNCGHCVLAPGRISRCPCGKYALDELGVEGIRTKCTDPIPTCESVCNKILQCGSADKPHRCRLQCHTGPCPPCSLNSSIVCRCKQVKKTVPCIEYCEIIDRGEFLCERRCRKKKNCGVHRCNEVCCVQDVHICTVVCNKRLSCGLHNCEYLCHPGQCVRCLQASFEEQFCHCGRTMRPPPIPCGASLPVCDEPCARPHPCNHPVNHKCHALTVCPPCTYLVERECYGKHEIRKNIPCHIEGVSCGRECSKPMPCGVHTCNRRCHFGDCLKAGESCTQPCSTIRKGCEHPCNVKCHGLLECPNSPCEYPVTALCECGRRKETMRCHEVEKIKQRLRAIAVEDEAELEDTAKLTLKRTKSMENLPILPCTDDCKKIARNKKLADALSIVTNDDGDTDSPMITFSETMKSGLKSYPQLVTELEKIFLKLIEALADPTLQTNVLSYNFTPMPMEKRRLIHEYASYFQLESLSVDEPPKRSVIVNGRRGVARPPLILLSDLQKYPSVLKYTGSTTLRQNVNDEIKKAAAAAEEEGNGMKQMRAQRTVYKRMPPKISVPAPIKQANAFAVLGSDDECDSPVVAPPVLNNQLPTQRDVDWWSDDDNDKNGIEEKPREEVAEQGENTVEEFGEIQNQEDLEEDKLEERSISENL